MFLLLFHHALQRMLVLACRIHDACDLGLGHFVGEDPAHADALLVDVEHDARRLLKVHAEESLQDLNSRLDAPLPMNRSASREVLSLTVRPTRTRPRAAVLVVVAAVLQ